MGISVTSVFECDFCGKREVLADIPYPFDSIDEIPEGWFFQYISTDGIVRCCCSKECVNNWRSGNEPESLKEYQKSSWTN